MPNPGQPTIGPGENAEKVAALGRIQGVKVDEAAIRAHVMRPENVVGVISDRGREDAPIVEHLPPRPAFIYELDVNGFIQSLETALTNLTAGYSLRLHQNGSTIATVDWNWAKEPQDTSESWTPDVRMHVASLSKIVTAIAMTKLLNEKSVSYDTPIIDYLPAYWSKSCVAEEVSWKAPFRDRISRSFPMRSQRRLRGKRLRFDSDRCSIAGCYSKARPTPYRVAV